jgi:hypothetical protein
MTAEPRPAPAPARRLAVLFGGYVVAALLAATVVRLAYAAVPGQEAASGMAAFGMLLFYLAIFASLSLAHSVLLMVWLRGAMPVWRLALMALPAALAGFTVGFFVLAL